MARRLAIPSQHVELRIIGPKDSFFASRVQRLNMNTDIPTTDVGELGNPELAGIVSDTPNITLTFSAYDVGIKIFATLTGYDPTAYPAGGVVVTELSEADAVIYIKSDTVADYVKTGHAKRMQVRDFSFSYSVDGESTEDYTLIGSEKRWFKNDVIVDRFVSGGTSFTLSQTPLVLNNGNYAMSVILDGAYLEEVAGAPATGQYRIVGTTLTTGDSRTSQCIAVYHANPAGTNWTDISDTDTPAAIRGRDAKVTIGANGIDRVQSVTINGNLNVQNVREMGSRVIIGYQKQVPTIDGTITVLDTDTELIELLTTGVVSTGAGAETEFTTGGACVTGGVDLTITLYDPCDATQTIVEKTIVVSGISVTSDAFTSNYNQNVTQTFNWRSSSAVVRVYSGAV